MITLVSTPEHVVQATPEVTCRWLATESPNNFRLLRRDFDIVSAADNGGALRLTVGAGLFNGSEGDHVSVFNRTLNAMFVGEVQAGSTDTIIDTNIAFQAGFDPGDPVFDSDRDYSYFNDNTLHAGYYFEGRLTINGVLNPLTIIASPDSFGYADLDVSGILRVVTSLGKTGDYSEMIMAETNKSGSFSLEYRECWFGLEGDWIQSEGVGSPADPVLWWYAEAVRSEEQGSNLHEFVPDDTKDAPFLNFFERPVYFAGLPFDLSFILPERPLLSPAGELTVTLRKYSSANVLLSQNTYDIPIDSLDGRVCSLTIDPAGIEANASHFTAEITAP